MKLPKEYLFLSLVVIFLLGMAAFLGLRLSKERETQKLEQKLTPFGTPTPVFRDKFDQSEFSPQEYVNPVGRESFSDLVQIRGVVFSWDKNLLKVKVMDEILSIALPGQVMVRCMDEFMTDAQGREVKTSDVYLDFTQAPVKGNTVDSSLIPPEIPAGKDITVQAKLEGDDKLEAEFIVGYGCSL